MFFHDFYRLQITRLVNTDYPQCVSDIIVYSLGVIYGFDKKIQKLKDSHKLWLILLVCRDARGHQSIKNERI